MPKVTVESKSALSQSEAYGRIKSLLENDADPASLRSTMRDKLALEKAQNSPPK
jgi:hypothetical protein